MSGTLAHTCNSLPDLWVCWPCTILQEATHETVNRVRKLLKSQEHQFNDSATSCIHMDQTLTRVLAAVNKLYSYLSQHRAALFLK